MPEQRELVTAAALEIPRFVSATVLFQTAMAERLGISPTELHGLQLVISGAATAPTQLAAALGMTTGAVTRMLDRMAKQRLVERVPDPADRRRLLIRPLPDRLDDVADLYAPMARFFGERLGKLDRRQLAALLGVMTDGRAFAEREAARLRSGSPENRVD
ncbi:MarR family winged helix-turn-helix transcriptional regulator [Amycolatopsis regifaucium]|uniref:MarR family transcriptional regulator n=1 Tax=Amycolatopsis regifaucium TaxID=546365 RepID=A0A154MUU5_9PSEU|nr:MarR family transcriptional regulator [Amycolatopsis regifaucium]KZB88124.1 MarR family transcriptional regulator [Amycolatopsis regifaucium]OKA04374.1 MarR family transcriptional regulator [Amycolatopsis regifaucium]SFH47706.1 DNA-binding transcriptional regulator, MarR family [Amycolatopsis regifaucium]